MRNSIIIKIQTVPLLEQIEKRDRKREPHLEICPDSLAQVFQTTHLRQERENRFDQHPVVPLAASADLQVFRLVDFASKAGVCQNNHFPTDGFNEREKFLIRHIRRCDLPISNESELIDQQTEFADDDPLPRSKSFLADAFSMRLMIFANRMAQLNAVRIDDAENSRFRQELFGQPTMCFQTAKKSRSVGQSRKQIKPILFEPAIKSVLRRAFQSKQQSQSNQFTDRKFSLKMFLLLWQHIIYAAKKFYDKVFLSHGLGFLCKWFCHLHNRNFSVTFSTSTNG
jgi:hypothetical protein